jgi:YD repeat-containing protein
MPKGLRRFHASGDRHFTTCSCYRRQQFMGSGSLSGGFNPEGSSLDFNYFVTYDSGTNAQGHLTSLTDQAGTASYTYDIMGRMATETRSLIGASSNSRFIDGSDETDVNGSTTGAFNGIQGRFNSNCGGSCEAKGSLYDLPGHPNAVSDLEKKIGKSLEDNLNFFGGHGKADNYRFGAGQLTHIVDHLAGPDNGKQEVHFEGHAPGTNLQNFVLHQVDAIRDAANHQSSQEPRLP